jgi:hypothetical protein
VALANDPSLANHADHSGHPHTLQTPTEAP